MDMLSSKASWKIIRKMMPQIRQLMATAFTTTATLATLKTDPSTNNVVVDPTKTIDETVALVGLHVVVRVEGHPEFIWTTFEHVMNSPDLPNGVRPQDSKVVSNQTFTFYDAGTLAKDCNINPVNQTAPVPLQLKDAVLQLLQPVTPVLGSSNSVAMTPGTLLALRQAFINNCPTRWRCGRITN